MERRIDVHPTAVVAEGAEVGEGVEIGPYCVIGPQVRIGRGCKLHAHVVIEGDSHLGEENELWPFVCVGAVPQHRTRDANGGALRIGDRNRLREYVTVHIGTTRGGGCTRIGDDNMLLCAVHVAHDVRLGSNVTVTNGTAFAGHSEIQDQAVIGAMVGLHQFTRIGRLAMIGAGAMVSKDAPPFATVQGDRARIRGVNVIGMRRAGIDSESISVIKRAYRRLFWRRDPIATRVAAIRAEYGQHPMVAELLDFVTTSQRGVLLARRTPDSGEEAREPMDS